MAGDALGDFVSGVFAVIIAAILGYAFFPVLAAENFWVAVLYAIMMIVLILTFLVRLVRNAAEELGFAV